MGGTFLEVSRPGGGNGGGGARPEEVDFSVTPLSLGRLHPPRRSERFPSVERRVRFYMSDTWYDPDWTPEERGDGPKPAGDNSSNRQPLRFVYVPSPPGGGALDLVLIGPGGGANVTLSSSVASDVPLSADPAVVRDCARPPVQILRSGRAVVLPTDNDGRIERRINFYCEDVLEALAARDRVDRGRGGGGKTRERGGGSVRRRREGARNPQGLGRRPMIVQLGDQNLQYSRFAELSNVPVPVLHKWRYVDGARGSSLSHDPFPPIIWPLEYERHFEGGVNAARAGDVPWEEKRNDAVWRGELTGVDPSLVPSMDRNLCQMVDRCRLCLDWVEKTDLVNVGIAETGVTTGDFWVGGVLLSRGRMEISDMLRYKMLISVEGNDVATNLKWALLSRSIVLMKPPTKSSWAMEELLEPWVHYVPLLGNYSNLGDAVRWVRDHDDEARRIAERATLFMSDMLYHPDAKGDDRKVRDEILRRYDSFFRKDGVLTGNASGEIL